MRESNVTHYSRRHDSRTNTKADFTLVVYGLFVLARVGRESWRSPFVKGKLNCLTCSALLAFLSIQPVSRPTEAATSIVHLPTPAVLA